MIPNIFHFINIGPREFNLVHFLSIYSAYKLNDPDIIYLYCDRVQKNNIYWDILQDIITIKIIEPPKYYNGVELESYQYKADIIRMEQLIKHGGIYMDLDIISINPLTDLMVHKLVIGGESGHQFSTYIHDIKSITNAVIMAEKQNPFIIHWLDKIGTNLTNKAWAYHAVQLPLEILKGDHDFDVHLVSKNTFMPFCFRYKYIFAHNMLYLKKSLKKSKTIHLWETIWKDIINDIDIKYFNINDNIFTRMMKNHINIFFHRKYLIKNIVGNLAAEQCYDDKMLNMCEMYYELYMKYKFDYDPEILFYSLKITAILELSEKNNIFQNILKKSNINPEKYTYSAHMLKNTNIKN